MFGAERKASASLFLLVFVKNFANTGFSWSDFWQQDPGQQIGRAVPSTKSQQFPTAAHHRPVRRQKKKTTSRRFQTPFFAKHLPIAQ